MGFMNSLKNCKSEGDYYEEDDQMNYYEEPEAQLAQKHVQEIRQMLFHFKALE